MPDNTNGTSDGETSDGESSHVETLSEIFTDIADDETFVESQRTGRTSKRLVDGSDPGDYVEKMVKSTGLSETIEESDADQRQE
jgi:hypothetical protein